MSTAPRARVTVEDYLAQERAASEKHILWDGEVFAAEAMAGGTFEHNTVCANVVGLLHAQLRGSRCRVVTSDQRVWVPGKQGFVYPDATVACGPLASLDGKPDVLTNPTVVVEVLSEATERFDRGDKFAGYRSIASLRHYVMVASRERLVEHYARGDDGAWILREHRAGDAVQLHGPELVLRVDELYENAGA